MMQTARALAILSLGLVATLAVGERLGDKIQASTHAGHVAEHVTPLHRNDHRMVESKQQKALRLAKEASADLKPDAKSDSATLIRKASPSSVGLQVSSEDMEESGCDAECRTKHTRVSAVQLEALREAHHAHADQLGGAGVSAMPLKNVMNSQYTGPVSVGTQRKGDCSSLIQTDSLPFLFHSNATKVQLEACHLEPQSQVWVIFDTGSTNLWIASDVCAKKPCRDQGRGFYDHTKSHTFGKPDGRQVTLDVKFGTGELKGPLGEDDLHLGAFTVKKERFGLIQEEMGTVFAQIPFEGILGLGFPSMSANGIRPLFDNIIDQHVLKKNEFAFYFNPEDPSRNAMFWGGVDRAFYKGEIKTFPVSQEHYWALDLHDFIVGNESLIEYMQPTEGHTAMSAMEVDAAGEVVRREKDPEPVKRPKMIVDSGTTYYTAEKGLFQALMKKLKTTSCSEVNDSSYPTLTYVLMDADQNLFDLTIPPHMYMVSDSQGKKCSPAFMEISLPKQYGPGMIMGEVFMRHWYTVFSRGSGERGIASVGFAKARHGEKELEERLDEITKGMPELGGGQVGFSQKEAEEMSQVEKVEKITGIQQITESSVGLQQSSEVRTSY